MRILKLRFSNLNSLKGEYCIPFNESPLSDTGLFAITGETGAGKTTILDAITLALYNSVARGSSEDDIMSYGTASAYTEVEFETQGKKYRASWSKRRSRDKADGAMQSSKWSLADITTSDDGVFIAEKKKDVKNAIEEITGGLDKDKFLKSVMLAQGNFAAFLEADKNERGELLEKITGRTDYSAVSIAAYKRFWVEKNKLDMLEAKIDTERLLSPERVEELNEKCKLQNVVKVTAEQNVKDKEAAIRWIELLTSKELKVGIAQAQLLEAEEYKQKGYEKKERLDLHEKTNPFREQLFQLQAVTDNLITKEKDNEILKNKIPGLKSSINQKKEQLDLITDRLKKLGEDLEKTEPDLEAANNLDLLIVKGKDDLHEKEKVLTDLVALINKIKSEKVNAEVVAKSKRAENESLTSWINDNANCKEIGQVTGNIKALTEEWDKSIVELNSREVFAKQHKQEFDKENNSLETQKKKLLAIRKEKQGVENQIGTLKEHILKTYEGKTRKELKINDEKIQAKEIALKEIVNVAINWNEKNTFLTAKRLLKEEKEQTKKKLVNDLAGKEKLAVGFNEKLVLLEKIRDQEMLLSKYEDDRKKLVSGDPCFLCGSLYHPYSLENPEINISETERQIRELKVDKDTLEKELKNMIAKTPSQAQIDELVAEIGKLEKVEEYLKNDFYDKSEKSKLVDIQISKPDKIEHLLLLAKEELKVSVKKIKELDNSEEELVKIEKKYQMIMAEEAKLDKEISVCAERLKAMDAVIIKEKTEIADFLKQSEAFAAQINTVLKPYSQILTTRHDLDQLVASLKKHSSDYENKINLKNENEKLISGLEQKIAGIKEDIKNREEGELPLKKTAFEKENKEQQMRILQRKNLLGGRSVADVKTEFKALIATTDNSRKELEKSYLELQNSLTVINEQHRSISEQIEKAVVEQKSLNSAIIEQAKGVFADINEIRAATLSPDEFTELKTTWDDLTIRAAEAKTRLETLQAELAEEKARKITELPKEEAELELKDAELVRDTIVKELGEWNQLLFSDKQTREQNREITAKIEKQQVELLRWTRLNDLIGSANGDRFRRFAQSITLRVLAEQANAHLEMLSGRYQVVLSERDDAEKLELDIIDTFQADNVRPMNTLSGGESFLVSLALALGLSNMASKNNPVKSLFIDEGFGTLDPETLDTALCALDNLQADGKTIGIISHVEQLKERIPCQIQIIKMSGGVSRLEIVG